MPLFGRASLFVYWVHVELVYGVVSDPLHRTLSFPSAVVGFAALSVGMFALAMAKNRAVVLWKEWRQSRRVSAEQKLGAYTT
jgi:hypothetical protein